VFGGILWEGDFRRQGKSVHDLIQEIDLGLPHRLEFGFENELGLMGSDAHATSGTVEARYAFTNWNVVPLNPAISAEYIFGWGKSVRSASQDSKRRGNGLREQPDAVALRLLLGQDLAGRIGYGFNFSLTQDVTRDSGREIGLSQSITYGAMKGKLEFGAEMRY